MARINLDTDKDHLVTPTHSDARGPVVLRQVDRDHADELEEGRHCASAAHQHAEEHG